MSYRTLQQNGAYLWKSIAIPEPNTQPNLATMGFSQPFCPLAGDTHPGQGSRKQQQPQQGKIKQKSTNKLKSVTQVPALTSSILLLLPLRQRRFPAQKAAWLLPEYVGKRERVCFAGEANAFLQPISIALYLPAAARNLAPQIRKAAFPILPIPPAGEVWQLHVFWSWEQQRCMAGQHVAKSHGFGREVPRCVSRPRGWQALRLSTHLLPPHSPPRTPAEWQGQALGWIPLRPSRSICPLHPFCHLLPGCSSVLVPSFLPA